MIVFLNCMFVYDFFYIFFYILFTLLSIFLIFLKLALSGFYGVLA